ncbi:MAG: hypothetical protein CBB71_00490 [Rhodopirellula sp. TMED11]|nr:MAG: hypothetical protein CBB71_00490 [Rhodopirellula sp. TMED11]
MTCHSSLMATLNKVAVKPLPLVITSDYYTSSDIISTHTEDERYGLRIVSLSTSSAVPEPSTAITIGLLGVLGFAGNRRRRGQVSAA